MGLAAQKSWLVMHFERLELKNIRSARQLDINFSANSNLAGWHVIIGENGTGKTTILRSIALCLIGPEDFLRLNPDWSEWVRNRNGDAEIAFKVRFGAQEPGGPGRNRNGIVEGEISFYPEGNDARGNQIYKVNGDKNRAAGLDLFLWRHQTSGWFSCGFGAMRRFSGGAPSLDFQFNSYPRISAHISLFEEGATLSSSITWLKDVHTRRLQKDGQSNHYERVYKSIFQIINRQGLLPQGLILSKIDADGLFFSDPFGTVLNLSDLSDGIKSVMTFTLEILRLLHLNTDPYQDPIDFYSDDGEGQIPVHGVVLIDEIDAHLHPSWQTRIGDWFTQSFPNMQFIVTTHSPLICRAAEKGTIWHLYNEDGETKCKEVVGENKDKLVYGSILDSVSTGLFGDKTVQSDLAIRLLEEYARLETKALFQRLTESDAIRLKELQSKHLA